MSELPTPEEYYGSLSSLTGPASLGWSSPEAQQTNFRLLLDLAEDVGGPLTGRTVHDAGCGHGDLLPHLIERGAGYYTGTDLMAAPLEIARRKWGGTPSATFLQRDLLRDPVPDAAVTLVFGALAYHPATNVERLLERLWERTTGTLAFITWWKLPKEIRGHRETKETQKVIESFVRRRGETYTRRIDYGIPHEAMFAVARRKVRGP